MKYSYKESHIPGVYYIEDAEGMVLYCGDEPYYAASHGHLLAMGRGVELPYHWRGPGITMIAQDISPEICDIIIDEDETLDENCETADGPEIWETDSNEPTPEV